MTDPSDNDHWLVRTGTIRWLWRSFILVLVLTVLAQFLWPVKGYFGIDSWLGFGAFYGFLCCLGMVLLAKGLGSFLKREEHYYRDQESDD